MIFFAILGIRSGDNVYSLHASMRQLFMLLLIDHVFLDWDQGRHTPQKLMAALVLRISDAICLLLVISCVRLPQGQLTICKIGKKTGCKLQVMCHSGEEMSVVNLLTSQGSLDWLWCNSTQIVS